MLYKTLRRNTILDKKTSSPPKFFLLIHYLEHKIQLIEFYEHFNVSFFIKDIRAHRKGLVKPGNALYLWQGVWPGTAGCI